ncbi:INO80 complex subunit B-like conserved region [Kalmanozyma brasiliensis GHG001]|uniref:INO80 complex subunit B-like conserved region domain-containing protein n=1 Tax=Kalmanozyma brasiliensis (strain GHG001) TaxID=1365824 RepID=V5ERX7_KALBG|nr:INO80 complex subunit B-like conserved region [Kalmanozyma brasiliensis GHG001]EST04609.1 INO80 complex subunit B-like conserved region [Kalmanozyma brasiliensis GHG001]
MPPADYDALSDGSDLTGDSASDMHDSDDAASAPRTPRKRRRPAARTIDSGDEDEVADELEEDEDELEDDDDYDAPSTSRRGATRTSGRPSRAATTPKRAARTSTRTTAAATPASTGKKILRVKLTRTPQAPKETSPAPSKTRTTPTTTAVAPAARRAKDASKVKWKPRAKGKSAASDSEDEIPVPASDDELLDSDDPSRAATVDPDAMSGDDSDASEPDEATAAEMAAIMGKTARQLAREGGVESEHLELPMFDPNRKKKLTENEIALRRSETARKRKNQVEKKLEDDKVETINRLLKKQVGRSRNKLPKAGEEESDEEVAQAKKRGREELDRKALKEMPAPFFRYVDRVDGKVLAVPTGPALVEEVLGANYVDVNQALIQELETPIEVEGLSEKAKAYEEKVRQRLAEQGEQWKQDHALDEVWGREGLYEYKLRTVLNQSRRDWIGSRKAPTPEQETQPEDVEAADDAEEQDDEGDEDAADDAEDDQDQDDDDDDS